MADNLTLDDLTNLTNSSAVTKINANSTKIENEFDKVLYKDGREELTADLDTNGKRILNSPAPVNPTDLVRMQDVDAAVVNALAYGGEWYLSLAAGEAATVAGQKFAVVVGGLLDVYLRTSGVSTLLFSGLTKAGLDAHIANLASTSGAGLVGLKITLASTVARTAAEKMWEFGTSVMDFMTLAERTSVLAYNYAVDVTAAIQAAIDALVAGTIGALFFPDAGYRVSAAVGKTLATMPGYHIYGQSVAKTIIKQFTNNIPIFEFGVDLMHTINWHSMTLTYNTAQTGNTNAAAFKFLNGGGAKSIYASHFHDLFITNCYWALDASAVLWWGNEFVASWIVTSGGAFNVSGSAGQPRCRFSATITGGASGVYTANCNAMLANWNLEILGSSGPILSESGGGRHHIENLNWEGGTVVAGTVFLLDLQNSQLTATGPLSFQSVTLAAGANAQVFSSTAAAGFINITTKPTVSFSGAGISAQGAGSQWQWFGRGDANMTSKMEVQDISAPWTAGGVSPACHLTDVGGSATADFVKVVGWSDKARTALMGDADYTTTFNGPGTIISNVPRTAARKIITPYVGTGGGNNLFGAWEREVIVMPQATGAFAIDVRNSTDTTTLYSIPGNVFGRWLIRWDRQAVRSGDALSTLKVFYLGPISQDSGWTVGSGTENKGAFAAYAGATVSAAYVQAEAQATNDAAKNASQRLLAIEKALRAAGLIKA